MTPKKMPTALCDFLGLCGLILAGLALVDSTSARPVLGGSEALDCFTLFFFGALLAFACARSLQIAELVRRRTHPRRERALAAAADALAGGVAEPAPAPAPSPFQRAA